MRVIGRKCWDAFKGLLKFVVSRALKLFKRELTDEQWEKLLEFVKFGLVGVSNTAVSYTINALMLFFLRNMELSWDFIIGNLTAFLLSVLWSFYWNNKYVFTLKQGESRNLGHTLLKTYISYGFTGIVLNNVLSFIWIVCLHISKYIAPILNLLLSIPLNFLMNKLWAYK